MIQCMNVQKSYGAKRVLTNINFSIEEPKIVALIGRNGVGKSTLLRLLTGRIELNGGELKVAEQQPYNNLVIATNTMLIEESMLFPSSLTLLETLKAAKPFYPNWQQGLAEKLASYAQLDLNAFYHNLSKGQAATFRLIYGLCTRCAYTYLDEPMNGLDEGIRADFYRLILKEYIAAPRMLIISTHYLNEVRHLAEDILILHEGQIEMHTTVDELALFALKITGPKAAVLAAIERATVLHLSEETGFYEAYVVAEGLDEKQLQALPITSATNYKPASRSECSREITDDKSPRGN